MTTENDRSHDSVFWTGPGARVGRFAFPVLLFLFAFLPRSIYLVARSLVWHQRANRFIEAIAAQNWQITFQAPHPGVVTMWLAGIGRKMGGLLFPNWSELPLVKRMEIELIPLALVISLGIVLTYFILTRIFDRQIAIVSSLLLALDPFHISVSKTLHVDALMAIFMMLSVLFLWLYIVPSGHDQRRYIVFSGVMASLALLSKTPALFLVPYTLMTLAIWQIKDHMASSSTQKAVVGLRGWLEPLKHFISAIAVWILALIVIYFLFWPSMWIQPLETLRSSIYETLRYADTPHPTRVLFMGQPTDADPGPLFYPVSILIRTTSITLPFFLISITLLFNRHVDRYRKILILLGFLFIGFFTLQMTLGEKKFIRYLLATFEFVILLAGIGAVYFSRWISRGRRWLYALSLLIIIAIQGIIAITRHPYYGTHYNRLLGGPKTILENAIVPGQQQGEGLDLAGEYLSNLPESEELTAGVLIEESFGRYFDGLTVPMIDESVDYLVFARNWMARETRTHRWEFLWEKYQHIEPDFTVFFDGVPYVWVFKVSETPADIAFEHELNLDLDGQIRLLGYDISPTQIVAGNDISLTLFWEAIEEPRESYTVFTHLLDSNGWWWGQEDHMPLQGDFPTERWKPGDIVRDLFKITVSPDAAPGLYEIELGMYSLKTLERLPITDSDGLVLPESRVLIPGPTVIAP